MIHTMPDKTVRVTSRFPDGRSTVYFDLGHGDGFTLEQHRLQPGICTLRMLHGYRNFTARYGDQAEAEADLADLNLMLADRHALPAASSVPALASTQPPIALEHGRRRGRGWKGTMAGLVLGALGAFVATCTLADRALVQAYASLPLDPVLQIDAAPTHDAVARQVRSLLDPSGNDHPCSGDKCGLGPLRRGQGHSVLTRRPIRANARAASG